MGSGQMVIFPVDDEIKLVFSTEELDQCCEELCYFIKNKFSEKIEEFISKNKKDIYNHIINHNIIGHCDQCDIFSGKITNEFTSARDNNVSDFVESSLRLMAHTFLKKALEN